MPESSAVPFEVAVAALRAWYAGQRRPNGVLTFLFRSGECRKITDAADIRPQDPDVGRHQAGQCPAAGS